MNLEAELEREKLKKNVQEVKQQDAKMTESLMKEAEQARKDAERLENDYSKVADERDKLRGELDEMKRLYSNLERRMKAGKFTSFNNYGIVEYERKNFVCFALLIFAIRIHAFAPSFNFETILNKQFFKQYF